MSGFWDNLFNDDDEGKGKKSGFFDALFDEIEEGVDDLEGSLDSFFKKSPSPNVNCPPPKSDEPKEEPKPKAQPKDKPKEEPKEEPKPWRLKVRVTSQKDVPADEVSVLLKVLEGGAGEESRTLKMVSKTEEFPLEGKGHRKYEVAASVAHYELVAKQEVTLEDGDNKQVTVELRPLPWVEFHVVEKKDGKEQAVEKVTFKLALPGDRKEEPVSKAEKIRCSDLKPGTCKIEEMSHDEFWEVEEVASA
jgi:hypothetical protein